MARRLLDAHLRKQLGDPLHRNALKQKAQLDALPAHQHRIGLTVVRGRSNGERGAESPLRTRWAIRVMWPMQKSAATLDTAPHWITPGKIEFQGRSRLASAL
jgi:hypothetical protein